MMNRILLVAIGGAVGSVLRYVLHSAVQPAGGEGFPYGTMMVNVLGCLAIGAVAAWLDGAEVASDSWRWLIVVGLLGGFTTFSAFSHDALRLMQREMHGQAAMYVMLTNLLCIGGAWIGWRAYQQLAA